MAKIINPDNNEMNYRERDNERSYDIDANDYNQE
jgi:hypothetical protein